MTTKTLSTVAISMIDAYGHTAKNMIAAYRIGGERVIGFADQRWDAAIQTGASRLSEELRDTLLQTRKRISGYYTKGLHFGTDRADMVVETTVGLAHKGVERIAANAERFDEATKLGALQTINRVALPAAEVASKVATRIEEGSSQLLERVAGKPAVVKSAVARKARTVKRTAAKGAKKATTVKRTAVRKAKAAVAA
jgi:hypothetical protein